ncbi:uncharacterized protein LOC112506058 [Cynara cardunculus var. scolymus]|uniref:uncharacterized protein LOC112506058 n=1 Tax=Cynara cardunculus var. scolymus TaxID=59895 RepID=UPI000D62C27C|nr:uncharacterized protein LOC112506058 [Cynara cardunculus var. scolymus]
MATENVILLDNFEGVNVLTDQVPTPPVGEGENAPTQIQMAAFQRSVDNWNVNEYNCRNYILNGLDDSLYDIYPSFNSAREIWESLESKYKTEVACSKRFIVDRFLNFKMNDSKSAVKQVEELQVLVHELEIEGMGINSNFLVGSIIDKLPPSWKNFKLYLKHLSEDMSFEQLILKLRVEEDNRMNEKADAISLEPTKNMVTSSSFKPKFQRGKGKATGTGTGTGGKHHTNASITSSIQRKPFKKKPLSCWVCGKPGETMVVPVEEATVEGVPEETHIKTMLSILQTNSLE